MHVQCISLTRYQNARFNSTSQRRNEPGKVFADIQFEEPYSFDITFVFLKQVKSAMTHNAITFLVVSSPNQSQHQVY